jgi:hypothetical protein
VSRRVFEELVGSAREAGKSVEPPVSKLTAEPAVDEPEDIVEASEDTVEASEDTAEVLSRTFGEVISDIGADKKALKGTREVQRKIETRLESLTKMFSSNRDKQEEPDDEEDDD